MYRRLCWCLTEFFSFPSSRLLKICTRTEKYCVTDALYDVEENCYYLNLVENGG